MSIILKPVTSSNLAAVGYDALTFTLRVQFKGTGSIYEYPDVTPEVHDAFVGADSVGSYFAKHIKKLPFKKIS